MRLGNSLSAVKKFFQPLVEKVKPLIPTKVYYKQSLFIKYLSFSLVIVFLSFLALGIILTVVISNFWNNQQIGAVDAKANYLSDYIPNYIRVNNPVTGKDAEFYYDDPDGRLREVLETMAAENQFDIMIVNPASRVVKSAGREKSTLEDRLIDPTVTNTAMNSGKYSSRGNMNGVYQSDRYIVAVPLYLNQYSGREKTFMAGAVVITADTNDLSDVTGIVTRLFILSAVAALFLSILAISIFSYNMVKPLKQMAIAAKQFGKGDFSVRVAESTNDEIGELAVSFNNMAESLSSSEITRKSFIANVSHELKTPMTTISGFIDGILDGTIPPEKHSYYLNIVSDEVKRLSRLVHSMLNLSRIDNGELKINYQNFDLFSTLVTIVITFEQEIDKRNIDIRGLDSLSSTMVYGDKDLLYQVIYNLIENAVKFTNNGGYIEFNIIENSSGTVFVIKNSGQGIKKAEIPLVFDRFYKTDKSRSKDKKGLGLGLFLVRSIIRKHGGEITATSEYGEYTEFRFDIPKKQEK